MDLTKLVTRLGERENKNIVVSFEEGRVVTRPHQQVYTDVRAAVSQLLSWGIRPGMRVGIRAANCYQWIVFDLALIEIRAVSVALTDDFADTPTDLLFGKYSLSLLLLLSRERRADSGHEAVAFLDDANGPVRAIDRGIESEDHNFECPGLIFSSGSSGRLKGLTLNRRGIEVSVDTFTQAVAPHRDDCFLLFLPISNFQQRLMYYSALWYGFDLVVTDPARLFRALKDLHPTILIAPPILYETFETRFLNLPRWKRMMAQVLGAIVRRLPVRSARKSLAKALFKDVYQALGGRMRFMVTGMAPIRRSALELFDLMQLPLFETYGMIEFGPIALNLPGACKRGSVGRSLPGVGIKLADDGEVIVVREHSIASGYFECAEGDAEKTFVGNHCIATGDVGRLDEDGYLHLTGRKREIIITAGGHKVHPEVLEAEIEACQGVARSVVFGTPDSPTLTAVVLPRNPSDEEARSSIEQFVEHLSERRSATPVGKVIFTDITFTRENGFLRPNLKLDRKKIAQHFQTSDPHQEMAEPVGVSHGC